MPSYGTVIGDPNAKIKIVEFADLQCPFCKAFQNRVNAVRRRYGNQVSQVFIHYPIEGHRYALPAAKAAECARSLDKFGEFVDVAYSKQDSLGIKTWTSYAHDAGIGDSAAFSRCMSLPESPPMVDRGRQLATSIQVQGTPTIIINGWRFPGPPQDSVLEETIKSLLADKRPPVAPRRWVLF
jgi:protein-disulfide isomerase